MSVRPPGGGVAGGGLTRGVGGGFPGTGVPLFARVGVLPPPFAAGGRLSGEGLVGSDDATGGVAPAEDDAAGRAGVAGVELEGDDSRIA